MVAMNVAKSKIQNSPVAKWFNPNHETTILPKSAEENDHLYDVAHRLRRINLPGREPDIFPYDPQHIAFIGQSGWDYVNQQIAVAQFEFDLAGDDHSVGCTADELMQIQAFLCTLPFCEVNTSTGGKGLHVRVPLSVPVPADLRSMIRLVNEHVLTELDKLHGLPFTLMDKVDRAAVGRGVLWLWADRMTSESFRSLNVATTTMDIDPDEVVASKRRQVERNMMMQSMVGDIENAVTAMLRITPKQSEKDGSRRLYAICCRAVEHNLNESQTVQAVRYYEQLRPFPKVLTDADILKRVADAENNGVSRGSALLFPELRRGVEHTPWANVPELTPWDNSDDNLKPIIDLDQNFETLIEAMERAIATTTYQRGGFLVRIDTEPDQCPLAVVDNGAPRIAQIAKGAFIEPVARAARYMKYDGRIKAPVEVLPATRELSCLYSRGYYPTVPLLNAVVERPILLGDGQVVSEQGYDARSGVYLLGADDYPGLMSTDEAVALLKALYVDFPLNADSDLAAIIAHLLTLAVRNIIPGPTPCFNLEGNRPGCGKGLILDVGSTIVEGRIAPKYPGACNDEELRKVLCSIALSGQSQFVLDNVKGKIGGPVLESCISSCRYSGRMLGHNEEVDLPLQVTWAMTSNGVVFTRDMARRTVTIGMETDNPTPHLRDDFTHPDLLKHVQANRVQLYMACLSIIANHLNAGCPDHGLKPMGSFEEWDRIIRRAVIGAGLADPLTTVNAEDEAYIEPEIAALHKAWVFNRPISVKEAVAAIERESQRFRKLRILLSQSGHATPSQCLGQLLRQARGLVIDGKSFSKTSQKNNPKWSLE